MEDGIMHKTKGKHTEDFDIYGDIARIKEALADVTHDVKGKANSMLLQSIDDVKEKANNVQENVGDYVTEKPFKSIGIAMLAGVVIGYLLHK